MTSIEHGVAEAVSGGNADLRRGRLTAVSTLVFVLASLSVSLPFLYVFLIFGDLRGLPASHWLHACMNAACTILVMLFAWTMNKRDRSQLAWILLTTLFVHGAMLFAIVLGRLYFSRPMIFTSSMMSVVASLGLVWLRDAIRRPRIGVIAFDSDQEVLGWIPGRYEMLSAAVDDLRAYDIILVDFDDDRHRDWMRTVSRAMLGGQDVRHLAEYVEDRRGRVSIEHFHVDDITRPSQTLYRSLKRGMDLVLVAALAPVALMLIGLAALGIIATMGMPVFFRQDRVGYAGRSFRIWKLRTMAVQADEDGGATRAGDLRVTPLGQVLRRFRIDELPQLWNVLIGEMSFIGPRPEQPALAAAYAEQMPAFACRHVIRPGITGWAQVRAGYAADLGETREKLSYDLYYLKNSSVTLDLEIMFRTALTLISGRGVR